MSQRLLSVKKEEPSDEEHTVMEDEIKVEESLVQALPLPVRPVHSVVIERNLFVCSNCQCLFERNCAVKKCDNSKCNKCILHSKLQKMWGKSRKRKINEEGTEEGSQCAQRVLVRKLVYVCVNCQKPYERRHSVKLQDCDWLKCNKCILYSRFCKKNTIFN